MIPRRSKPPRTSLRLLALSVTLCLAPGCSIPVGDGADATTGGTTSSATDDATTSEVFERVAVIGASVSAGFGLAARDEEPLDLAAILAEAIAVEPTWIRNESSEMLFLDPEELGARAIEELDEGDPTLVVAVDFLFWFGYGPRKDDDARLARFEQGLALLDALTCPILVGDLPDMSHALEAEVRMLTERQIPSAESLATMNARLIEFADARSNVHIVPLTAFLKKVLDGGDVELRGNHWSDATDIVFQPDLLHTTLEGTTGIALLALDVLERARSDVRPEMVRWDASSHVATLSR